MKGMGSKNINKIGLLGHLGVIAMVLVVVEGLVYKNYGSPYWSLIGFLGFFKYCHVVPDELFREHIRKATSWTLLWTSLVLLATLIISSFIRENGAIYKYGLIASIVVGSVTFQWVLTSIIREENKGLEE